MVNGVCSSRLLMLRMSFLLYAISVCLYSPARAEFYNSSGYTPYTWPGGYPQPCSCAKDGVRRDNCDLFKCNCLCDVTAGKCDFNCCCDPDCSADQVNRFNALGVCDIETFSPSYVQLCYSALELSSVNPRTPLGGGMTAASALGDALCVVKQNNVVENEYYKDTNVQSSAIFSESGGKKSFDYLEGRFLQAATDSHYDQNDSIAVFSNTTLYGLVTSGSGYFVAPFTDFTGNCNDNKLVKFEREIKKTECVRQISFSSAIEFEAMCEKEFSVHKYVTDLYLAKSASVLASAGFAAASSVTSVSIRSVKFADYSTGGVKDVTAAYLANKCTSTAYSTLSAYQQSKSGCRFSSQSLPFSAEGAIAVCQGFVASVAYTITHSTSSYGTIDTVTAALTVSDVPVFPRLALITGTAAITPELPVTSVSQSFSVTFTSADNSQASNVNGNVVRRPRSGNPGYLQGLPVLFGQPTATSPLIVNEFVGGLTIPYVIGSPDMSNPAGFGKAMCPSSVPSATSGSTGVAFGFDISSGCSLLFNRSSFESFCCAGASSCSATPGISSSSPFSDRTSGLPHYFNITQGFIGIYGNADPLDINQWLQLATSVPSPTRKFNPRTGICSNMFTGLNIKLLVSKSGEQMNPQNKIVAALATVTVGDMMIRVPYGDDVTAQSFPLSIAVSFIQTNSQALQGYSPPAPPVLFRVPFDVFYPFYQSSAASHSSEFSWASASLLVPLIVAIYTAL